jgi:hypothetical protein
MPPGGFRLAVINGKCLKSAMQLRALMENDFGLGDEPEAEVRKLAS